MIFFLIFFTEIISQDDISSKIESIKEIESDTLKIEQYHSILTQIDSSSNLKIKGDVYNELGYHYSKLKNDEKAIEYYLMAIELRQNHTFENVAKLNASRIELSKVYKRLQRTDEQNQLLVTIIQEGKKDSITCRAYSDIGRNIAFRGDYQSALQYLNSVLADSELMKEVDHELIIRFKITYVYGLKYENSFTAKKDSPDLENFKKHQAEIEKKIDQSSLDKSMYYGLYNNLVLISEAFGGEQSTNLESFYKCLNFYREQNDEYYENLMISNIGTIYSNQNLHEKAQACYQQVIENSSDKDLVSGAYVNMGYYLNSGSFKEKIPYFYMAFDVLLGKEIHTNGELIFPSLKEIRVSTFELEFITYLIDLASIYVQAYYETNVVSYLHNAKEAIYIIDQLASQIRYESRSEASTLFWIEKGVDTYMLGVEVCHLLGLKDEAFYFMEKNKALLLQENIKTLQEKWQLNISSKTLEREYGLYYQRVDSYEKFLKHPDDLLIVESYNLINKEYDAFMDSLEQEYSGYAKTKKQIQLISLDEAVNNYVSDEKCFVEYILNEKDGYGVFCSSQEKTLFKILDVKTLQTDLSELKKYWTKPILNKTETSKFQKLANSVFLKLFPFKDALDKLSGKQITIISDQKLNHIPFEALPVSVDIELVDSYLINFCEISYLQSISVSEQIKQKENNPQFSLLGLAPYEFQLEGLPTLSKSKEAIEALSSFKDSKILMGGDATKKNFLEEINDYNIIHLNTHAGIDSFNLEPWIAFRDEKMSLSELYGKQNQAELVVLDACKTNEGKLLAGEGILNLSRGFFYNGAQSVLASNWNVNEKSGNVIIKNFYNNLQSGKTKSKALQLAKIEYLRGHQFSDILPYYWAAYTITGDISPIELRRNSNLLSYLGLAVLVFGLLFFLRTRFVVPKQ